jgi:homogentisate 1,2-dioxygenase
MSEFMGLLKGTYDAKESGFQPGCASLHNAMSPHGPDVQSYNKAINAELKPEKYENTMAFMIESRYPYGITRYGEDKDLLDSDYVKCWSGFKKENLSAR